MSNSSIPSPTTDGITRLIKMFKYLLLLVLLLPGVASACRINIVAFSGIDGSFNHGALATYAHKVGGCTRVFGWSQVREATNYINSTIKPYQLYGYSRGAASIRPVLEHVNRDPVYIITVGAWRTVDLDFTSYRVKFSNYFDGSGVGQKSPGSHHPDVPHYRIQEWINRYY